MYKTEVTEHFIRSYGTFFLLGLNNMYSISDKRKAAGMIFKLRFMMDLVRPVFAQINLNPRYIIAQGIEAICTD